MVVRPKWRQNLALARFLLQVRCSRHPSNQFRVQTRHRVWVPKCRRRVLLCTLPKIRGTLLFWFLYRSTFYAIRYLSRISLSHWNLRRIFKLVSQHFQQSKSSKVWWSVTQGRVGGRSHAVARALIARKQNSPYAYVPRDQLYGLRLTRLIWPTGGKRDGFFQRRWMQQDWNFLRSF